MTHVRKSHKKSRNGCIQCKRRRVKCDEKGPPCYSCYIRKLDCTYANANRILQRSSATSSPGTALDRLESHTPQFTPPAGFHQPEQKSQPQCIPRASRLQELQLMHHYSTTTYKTLARDQTDLDIWRDAVPIDAGTYEFLMDGILAVASLHIALENPEKRKPFTEYALSYHNSGLKQFSATLPFISPDNCDALLAFAVITALLTLAFFDSRISAISRTPFENILFISRLLRGIGAVVGDRRQWLMSGKLRALFVNVYTPSPGTAAEPRGDALESVRQAIFKHTADMDGEERVFYESAVGTLDACTRRDLAGVNVGALVAFPVVVEEKLISHLSENRYAAQMIFLYYGMLMSQLEDRWWARMFGRQLVGDLNSLIDTFHGQTPVSKEF